MSRVRVRAFCALVAVGVAIGSCTGDTGPAGSVGPAGPTGPAGPAGPTGVQNFRAVMTGVQEVPAVTTTATGTAYLTLIGSSALNFRIEVANITGVTAAHIHGPAPAGVATGVLVPLYSSAATGAFTGTLVQGTAPAPSGITFDSLLVLLRNANAYVNVHTTANPDGEIRGQTVAQ